MEGALVEVLICVGGFPVNVVQGAVRISGDANIKEQDLAVFYFHIKLDAGVLLIEVL